jgi:hypothetical protein
LIHVLGFFAAVLCASIPGCGDDNNDDDDADTTNSSVTAGDSKAAEIQSTCDTYCSKSNTCDDSKTIEQCVADCKAQLNDCMADEQDQVMQELRECAQESCNDFGGCTFGAGLQCTFGI